MVVNMQKDVIEEVFLVEVEYVFVVELVKGGV